RLIQFGVMKGLIRRLHKYPVLLNRPKLGSGSKNTGVRITEPESSKKQRIQ
ncbi:hypothetical protein AC249_AIPGENE5308, partial [Exaiptasia diaphana]